MLRWRRAMQKELENYFGCMIVIEDYNEKIPLPVFMTLREIKLVKLYETRFFLIDVTKETELSISAMKKQHIKYENVLAYPVAYKVSIIGIKMRNALIQNHIAFIDLPGNVFLPFLGIVLQDVYKKQNIKIDKMMPATQMVYLELLYQDGDRMMRKSEVAEKLNLTRTSLTRATAQLDAMHLLFQEKSGTEITIRRNYPPREYYEKAKQYLINPIQKVIEVKRELEVSDMYEAGESALDKYSSLNPPRIAETAIYKGSALIDQLEQIDLRVEEENECVKLQLWKYNPCYFARDGIVDPVSLVCSFIDNKDERIEMCIEEVLEAI